MKKCIRSRGKRKHPFKKILIVAWQDAYMSSSGDFPNAPKFDDLDDRRTISIGVKVDEDKELVHLSNNFDGISQTFDEFISIPKSMIKWTKEINCESG